MEPKLRFTYDRIGDILSIDVCDPYVGQDSDEIDEGVVARFNPKTHEVENLEILFFTKRLQDGETIELPLTADLRLAT